MNDFSRVERRSIPESRIAELRLLARSSDDAERRVAARLLQEIDAELETRDEADAAGQESA